LIFPTIEFAIFFAIVLTASWLLMPNPKYWKPFMLAASLFFYGFVDARWVLLLLFSIVANQVAATLISRSDSASRRKQLLIAIIVVDLGILGVFKYFDFFAGSLNSVLSKVGLGAPLPLLELVLPIGISFFTFQAISYVVDVHQGVARLAKPIDFAVYLSFFPHVVAGPIVRAREFIPQLATPRSPRNLPAVPALFLILGGLFKKIVIADFLATTIVDPVFATPAAYSSGDTAVAVYGYAAQIYCDFSGYTDIAIGLAMLLGFRFPQNFASPYASTSLQDFWRRWHMTLSRWLRDYVYIPLGGNRKGNVRTYVNLMVTMLLGGLWHGASWTFVIWGGIHGTGLAVERWWQEWRAAGGRPTDESPEAVALSTATRRRGWSWPVRLLAWFVTFNVVCLAWIFFRSPDLETAWSVLGGLFTRWGDANQLVTPVVLLAVLVAIGTQFLPSKVTRTLERLFGRIPTLAQGIIVGLLIVLMVSLVGDQGVAPFIYFQF
jgi:D-alanyl-lipoteichoic acid acyltransferase DltB (MBOAT superfamily)